MRPAWPSRGAVFATLAGLFACGALALPAAGQADFSEVGANPTALNFSSTVVGAAGETKSVVFTNHGSEPALIAEEVIDQAQPDFAITGSSCTGVLFENESCEVSVQFAPQEHGPRSAFLLLKPFTVEPPLAVELTGVGVRKAIDLPATSNLGPVTLGDSREQSVTVKNNSEATVEISEFKISGPDASDFAVANDNCGSSLGPAMGCEVKVRFTPSVNGAEEAELKAITDGVPAEPTTLLSGEGAAPELIFEPTSEAYGLVEVHSEGAESNFTLKNTGSTPVHLQSFGIAGPGAAQFWIGNSGCYGVTLAPGEACPIQLHFQPQQEGNFTAAIRAEADGGIAFEAPLSGRGARPQVTPSASPLEFGELGSGAGVMTRTLTLTNTGELPVGFFIAFVSGGDVGSFHVLEENCTGHVIQPTESCTAQIAFVPQATGTQQATISFFGAGEGALQLPLIGTGVASVASLTPGSADFGTQALGTAGAVQVFTLRDEGSNPVEVLGTAITGADAGQFRIAGDECTENGPAAGASCQVSVRFAPDTAGAQNAVLRVRTTAGTKTASLSGEGVTAATSSPTAAAAPLVSSATGKRCVVPNLKGKKLAPSKKALQAAGCKTGGVTKRKGAPARIGKVVAQDSRPGSILPAGARVALTVGGR